MAPRVTSRLLLATLLLALSACSTNDESPGASSAPATATVTSTVTVTATPTAGAAKDPAALGQTVQGDDVTVTVERFDPSVEVTIDDPQEKRWAGALVKVCSQADVGSDGKPLTVSWLPWSLAATGDATYSITELYGPRYRKPTYPINAMKLPKGRCVRGWVTFGVEPKAEITEVVYGNGDGQPVYWSVK